MNILKEFETIKTPLKKEWNKYKHQYLHTANILRYNISNNFIYEAGNKKELYESEVFFTTEKLENLFGLAYTSSGEFAAIWNTNTQARAKYGAPIYFQGVAIDENGQAVLIFHKPNKNKIETTLYFYDFEFAAYQERTKSFENAKKYTDQQKSANKLAADVWEILQQYKGKQYGDKTRSAINEKIRVKAQENGGGSVSLQTNYSNTNYLDISYDCNEFCFNCKFLTTSNTIQTEQAPTPQQENNGAVIWEKLQKQQKTIQKKAQELKKLIETYNTEAGKINQRPKASESIYSIDLARLSDGNFER